MKEKEGSSLPCILETAEVHVPGARVFQARR